jgi:hypothetical protein
MPLPSISFRLVPNVCQGSGRAVGMLEGDAELCADVLINLPDKDAKYLRYSMERWTAGINGPQSRSHRFDGTDYFVFKHVARQHRFYGFLYHPLLITNAGFLLCVLTTYARKKEDNTNPADLDRVKVWMNAQAAKAAIKFIYPDIEDEEKDRQL